MKKNNIKPLVMSALTALAMGAVGTVGTFALFTDVASTTIEVASGKIELTTSITNLNVWELGETPVSANSDGDYVDSIGGKTHLEGTSFNLTKWAPGDGMKFKVAASNSSTVKAKIRLKVVMTGELAPALTLQVKDADENQLMAARGNRSLYTEWVDVSPNGNPASYVVQVDFLNHGFEMTSRDQGEDNKYQNKSANIVVIYEAVQANADVSTSILERVNTKLATDQVNEGNNQTMYDAVQDYLELNTLYHESDLKPYYWNSSEDLFVEAANVVSDKAYTYFKMYDEMPTTLPAHSIYASKDWSGSDPISLTGIGFDVGSNSSAFTSINYVGASAARTNIIRTNSFDTDVVVTAPADVVRHYGDARSVVINGIAQSSYHEYGRVAFIEIAKGRVALESGSEVKNLHFAAAAESTVDPTLKTFDEIKVAYSEGVTLPTFSRDAVEIAPQGTLVVELQKVEEEKVKTQDFVWLYQQGLKEQIRITDEKDVTAQEIAKAPKSTDSSVAPKTATAAEQIANNLLGNDSYEELIVQGKIDATTGAVVAAEVENLVEETGLTEESKSAAVKEIIESGISDVAADDSYVARIGGEFYYSFREAFNELNENKWDNKTIRIIKNTYENTSSTEEIDRKFYVDSSIRNFGIYVEENCTLEFTSSTNSIFHYNTTQSGIFTLDGEGTITFTGDNQYGIVDAVNGGNGISTTAKNLTVISNGTGYLTNGHLTIESGKYKNIRVMMNSHCISGGMFSYNLDDYVVEGKMCVASGDADYAYVVADLDAAHASFSLKRGSNYLYFKTLDSATAAATESGDVLSFLETNKTYTINGGNKFLVYGGVTYDLNDNTIYENGGQPVFYNGAFNFTVENGTISLNNPDYTTLLFDESGTITAVDLKIDNSLKDETLAHCNNGVFVQDSNDYFSIKESAPETFKAKLTRVVELGERADFYFNCEHAVAEAIKLANPGSTVWANVSESDTALASNLHISDTITIIKDSSVEFPEFNGADGKGKVKTQIDENIAVFEIQESYAFKVGSQDYTADQFVLAWSDWTSANGLTFELQEDFEYKGIPNAITASHTGMVLKLNGHKLKFSGITNTNSGFLKTSGGGVNCTITIDGSNGGTIISSGCLVSNGSNTSSRIDLTVNGGTYICTGYFSYQKNTKATITFNSGTFVSSNNGGYCSSSNFIPNYIVAAGTCFGANSFNATQGLLFGNSLKRGDKLDVDKILNQDIFKTVK